MRTHHRVVAGVLVVGVVVAGIVFEPQSSATPRAVGTTPRDVQRLIIPPYLDADTAQIAAAQEQEYQAEVASLNAAQAQALADQLQRAAERLQAVAPPAPSQSGDVQAFLACTREIESHGNYEDVDSTQTYWGAYQFDQGTWNGAVTRAGFPEWAGQPPNGAPPAVQDAAAIQLYSERGNQPWGGRC